MLTISFLFFVLFLSCVWFSEIIKKKAYEESQVLNRPPPEEWLDKLYYFRYWKYIHKLAHKKNNNNLKRLILLNWFFFWTGNIMVILFAIFFLS